MSRHGGRGRGGFFGGLGLGALSIAGVAGTIGATWKFLEFTVKAKRLLEVRGENQVFVRLVDSARVDLKELERLMELDEVQEALRDYPEKVKWIQEKVKAMNESMGSITKYTKKVSSAWFLGPKTRIWWIIDEYPKLLHRQMELAVAKEGVMEVIGFLSPYELDSKEKEDEKRRMEEANVKYSKNVNVDVDIDVDRRERQVIEYDRNGRPIRTMHKEYREYDYDFEEEEYEPPRRRRQDLARAGFYQGELDGPLATRPRFWSQRDAGADYQQYERKIVREETRYSDSEDSGLGRDVPLRVHWPTQAKL